MNAVESLRFFIPELTLLVGAFVTLLADLFTENKKAVGILSLFVLFGAFFLSSAPVNPESLFFGFFTLDASTHFFRLLALVVTAGVVLASLSYDGITKSARGEYYAMFLFLAFGLILMAAATNLLMIFIAVEFVSILSYLMVGFMKKDNLAKEAAIKYLLYGSLASGIMLYGMSLLFGVAGSLELVAIGNVLSTGAFHTVGIISLIFVMTGLGFKVSMAPFHMWAPDVYQAAPTPVTGFLTVAPKALGFAIILRVLSLTFSGFEVQAAGLVAFLAILTMTAGNLIAVAQSNIKRLLAYSSVAQAGYILMGVAAFSETGSKAVMVYLAAYAFTNVGAFVAVIIASRNFGDDQIESYAGLSKRSPMLAASITLFLLSLAGIPPLAGFIGKFLVFSSAVESGLWTLVIAAALNSAVAAYYYFKVVRVMYLKEPTTDEKFDTPFSMQLALYFMLAGTIALGVFPDFFLQRIF